MAIVINGTGTISGLSVGGLPDGTVDAGTVAADVATQAELDAAGVGGATGVDFNDNVAVRLGNGGDLKFIHNGSNSYIEDTGTGALRVLSSYFNVRNPADNESMITATENGAVELYHNYSKKIETTSAGLEVQGKIEINSGFEFTAENGSTRMSIAHNTGNVWIDGNCSAASFTDRTPYPETLQLAYDVINSHKKLPDGQYKADDHSKQLDHSQLHEYVKAEDNNRNMSGVISCLVEVIKDLETRLKALEA